MDAVIKETKEQALKEMELFKTVFDGVRLLNMHALELIGKGLGSYSLIESEQKFDFWEKEHPCDNDSCIVLQALRDKDVRTKLEYIGSQLYEVTARYMEVEGEPYVLELVKRMDDNYMIDEKQREKLLRHFGGYHEQLYKDALTGAYNRRYFEEKIRKSTVSAGVAMIDLDDFKLYNDSFGHDTGDVVLITFVNIIKLLKNIIYDHYKTCIKHCCTITVIIYFIRHQSQPMHYLVKIYAFDSLGIKRVF